MPKARHGKKEIESLNFTKISIYIDKIINVGYNTIDLYCSKGEMTDAGRSR